VSVAADQVPPQNVGAEASVLGSMLVTESTVIRVIGQVKLDAGDFYLDKHALVFRCIAALHTSSRPVDELTVIAALDRAKRLEEAGGKHYVSELAARAPAPGNAEHHAEIVRDLALDRRKGEIGLELRNGLAPADAIEQLRELEVRGGQGAERWSDGDAFILDVPAKPPLIWGHDDEAFWTAEEPMMLAAPPGLGKTTIAQQLTGALAGIGDGRLLGYPVRESAGRVAYIAADRPAQAARSFRRMFDEDDRGVLAERLVVWRGPLPFDLASEPARLVPFLQARGIGTVIIDSLGAIAFDLASDEGGSRVFAALSEATAEGIDIAVLHHDRKREQGAHRVRSLDDVYGSRWLTAAAGSVVYLDGKAGDLVVSLRHLKQPLAEIGPLTIRHDHNEGRTRLHERADLLDLAADGVTVKEAAALLFELSDPDPNEVEKTRRRLDKLADRGDIERVSTPGEPTVYRRPE
jgi:replicative DNA helicase